MPPKSKITKEMIIEAGLDLIRTTGMQSLNVRSIASALNCSTQPIMYHFSTVDELKAELYCSADEFHSQYIMQVDFASENPMLEIGLRYIKFAAEERELFCFLFQSGKFTNEGFLNDIGGDGVGPMLSVLQHEADLTEQQCRQAFVSLFAAVHGFASLLANNSMQYDEELFTTTLNDIFMGVIGYMKGGTI